MEIGQMLNKAKDWLKQYKYAVLILVIGLALMCIPGKQTADKTVEPSISVPEQEVSLAADLESMLSQVSGAGKVKVLLSIAEGEKILYQYDEEADTSDTSSSIRHETVIITDGERNQQAVISQSIPPVYLGAVILCQGADQVQVKLAIVEAVSKATGLGSDRICVLKMK